jgi:hypothetical protein
MISALERLFGSIDQSAMAQAHEAVGAAVFKRAEATVAGAKQDNRLMPKFASYGSATDLGRARDGVPEIGVDAESANRRWAILLAALL